MYELEESKTTSQLSEAQSSYISEDEDSSSDLLKILVVVLSAVLLFTFAVVLGVMVIRSRGSTDNGEGNHDDALGGAGNGEGTPAPDLILHVPTGARKESSSETVTTAKEPRTQTVRTPSATHPLGVQTCPVEGYHGKRIGRIYGYSHGLSGFVYAASDRSVIITGLNYDGTDSAAHFRAQYSTARVNQMVGEELRDEKGSKDVLTAYKNATVQLMLPKVLTAYQSLGIYSAPRNIYFGHAWIPKDYQVPKEQVLGKPTSRLDSVKANEIVLTDSSTMTLKAFVNHGRCPQTYFVAAPTNAPYPEELTYLTYDENKMGELESYSGADLTLKLPNGCHWSQFKWFSVFCVKALSSLCDIDISSSASHQLPLHISEAISRH